MPIPPLTLSSPIEEIRTALAGVPAEARALLPAPRLAEIVAISMLHEDTLALMAFLASRSCGPILEIGPYVGGSTTALCAGAPPGVPVATIEVGGAHPTHPTRPSSDILADLRANLARLGLAERVTVINRIASSPLARREVQQRFGGERIGLVSVDADGEIARHLGFYADCLRDDCLLVVDDYLAEGAPDKQALTKPWIDAQVRQNVLREFGVFRWGTWFGQVAGAAGLAAIRAGWNPFRHESGHCYVCDVLAPAVPDTIGAGSRSPLRLFERTPGAAGTAPADRELGPAHSLHEEIRTRGGGRFSHWCSAGLGSATGSGAASRTDGAGEHVATLYFSTSDNSDPAGNGRRYWVAGDGWERGLDEL